MSRELTAEEAAAIGSLKRLARKWPQTLKLFAWSGTLCVMDADADLGSSSAAHEAVLDFISGIPNDGGDP